MLVQEAMRRGLISRAPVPAAVHRCVAAAALLSVLLWLERETVGARLSCVQPLNKHHLSALLQIYGQYKRSKRAMLS
jgi:hypothetical protein